MLYKEYTSMLLMVTVLASCAAGKTAGTPVGKQSSADSNRSAIVNTKQSLAEEKILDISYGPFERNKLDVYLPANRSAEAPFVFLIHGGGWVQGDKKTERGSMQYFLTKGYASATLNYRFVDNRETHYEQMLADIDSAVNYVIRHAAEWKIRNNNFIFMGASAGGHLSLLYSYTTNKKVKAIIAECAPTDFSDTAILSYAGRAGLLDIVQKMAGATYVPGKPVDQKFTITSPVHRATKTPVLIIHGTADSVVQYVQARMLETKLAQTGAPHKLVTLPGAGHDLNMRDVPTRNLIYNEIIEWIEKYGK